MALSAVPPLQLFIIVTFLLLSITVLPQYLLLKMIDRYILRIWGKSQSNSTKQRLSISIYWKKSLRAAKEALVYSYSRSFNGFAANLTAQERQNLDDMEGIVSVFPSETLELHTTRSWDFLGFHETAAKNPARESDIIVGMIDTGIWPDSPCFSDEGLTPPPSRWKGSCQNFTCNNKIIGARYYDTVRNPDPGEERSARDFAGHGTHTASTVAGRVVEDASLYGIASGTFRGAVPSARIAVYKVCWSQGCKDEDILAAFDDAIADGVDIISASIGSSMVRNYFADSLAIGSFHAMKAGILTSTSAGNAGQQRGTVVNTAPWMLSVAASTIDRRIVDRLVIGDQEVIEGNSINTFSTEKISYPFIYAGNAALKEYQGLNPGACGTMSLDEDLVKGKIVLCDERVNGEEPLRAGAKGAVMLDYEYLDISWPFPLPAVVVDVHEGDKLKTYLNSTWNPIANIHHSASIKDGSAPIVASFSGRGPNTAIPNILKPDISAPGLNILSAWSPVAPISDYGNDKRSVHYNIMSGTSASCPHVTGAAAYVKSFHPDFSPAALLSALITTATPMDPSKNPDMELGYGAGQINPIKAADPGLVYGAGAHDHVQMLCGLGYNDDEIRLVSGDASTCNNSAIASKDLNYPSMAFQVYAFTPYSVNFSRTVTNVGAANATYKATVQTHSTLEVTVNPDVLTFASLNEKQSFIVAASSAVQGISPASASLIWSDGVHSVRSPIVIHTGFM